MSNLFRILKLAVALAAGPALATAAEPAAAADAKPTCSIVLVQGAFAEGSSWDRVTPILMAKGYTVVAVQQPMSSLADDDHMIAPAAQERMAQRMNATTTSIKASHLVMLSKPRQVAAVILSAANVPMAASK
jgi:pimeloyl-ACP methyl ester carboxylesterase